MCWLLGIIFWLLKLVSVAGCLGYDVLVIIIFIIVQNLKVSVAGCLGYDVLDTSLIHLMKYCMFQLLVV